DGRTTHAGVELQAFARAQNGLYTGFAGTFARHRYDFDRQLPGGESIHSGDDVDTAPRELASLRAGIDRPAGLLELEWVHQGSYFLNPGNTARYPGHDLLNLRALWRVTRDWAVALRINNLSDRLYADRADFAFGHYRYLPGRRREVFVEITYRWF
ncbi:MAG TPA: TonB-dependent receptor, partial [Chromatiales bacterium]|nr:TonB-dependent receptor [Chromatiales bacterium]